MYVIAQKQDIAHFFLYILHVYVCMCVNFYNQPK